MKYEWKKQEKELYGAKTIPTVVSVPAQKYIMISGAGNPNGADFSNRMAALYSVAYAVKMAYKKATQDDFAVYPPEGVWQKIEQGALVKENLRYTLMIRQPAFIPESDVDAAIEQTKRKKPNPLLEEVCFATVQGGTCVQILHIGAYDDEPASFAKMDEFVCARGLTRAESCHREIYLNNVNRTEKSKLKTILRYTVKESPPGR
ncbi:GyrI-like domain-containing protein [Gemmiger sp.]